MCAVGNPARNVKIATLVKNHEGERRNDVSAPCAMKVAITLVRVGYQTLLKQSFARKNILQEGAHIVE